MGRFDKLTFQSLKNCHGFQVSSCFSVLIFRIACKTCQNSLTAIVQSSAFRRGNMSILKNPDQRHMLTCDSEKDCVLVWAPAFSQEFKWHLFYLQRETNLPVFELNIMFVYSYLWQKAAMSLIALLSCLLLFEIY